MFIETNYMEKYDPGGVEYNPERNLLYPGLCKKYFAAYAAKSQP
jgi:hypothetical protein